MSTRAAVTWGALIGSGIGSYIPGLWGATMFSFSALTLGALGAVAGIWLGYRLSN